MARNKTVFKNAAETCEAFALGKIESGRNMTKETCSHGCSAFYQPGNKHKCDGDRIKACYFTGNDLFSYGSHYLLARKGLKLNGVAFAVVNFSKYSNSTSKHSWQASLELRRAGFLVVKIESSGTHLTAKELDSDLVSLAIYALKSKTHRMRSELVAMQSKPYSTWWISEIRKSILKHNKLVARLGMAELKVSFTDSDLNRARRYFKKYEIAQSDWNSREQTLLIESQSGSGVSRRERRRLMRAA